MREERSVEPAEREQGSASREDGISPCSTESSSIYDTILFASGTSIVEVMNIITKRTTLVSMEQFQV